METTMKSVKTSICVGMSVLTILVAVGMLSGLTSLMGFTPAELVSDATGLINPLTLSPYK
ncbi:MAG: hypothetical protein ACYC69_02745 [Thermodesulfovibrionales bacterium]